MKKINRMKNYILALLIILSTHTISHAQQNEYTIHGYVKDSLTEEPMIGVTIMTSDKKVAFTNSYGFYSISSSKKSINLSFSHIGYVEQYKDIVLQSDISLDILLVKSVIKVDDILVVSKLPTLARTKSNGSITINSEQLKYIPSFLGEQDIFKYFQLLPGVVPGKEGSSGMNIRGGSSDQTLIMMDDIPIYNHSHAFGFVSIFSGEFIKSAELFKGYVPPDYGGRLSGVATMNMREGNRKEHQQSLQLGTTTASVHVEGPINGGKGSYLVGGRYFIPDLFLRAYAESLVNNEGSGTFGFYDITAKVSYDLGDKNTIYANFYTGRDALNIGYKYSGTDRNNNEKFETKSSSGLNWGNIVGSVRLSSQLSNRLFMNTTAYYSLLTNEKISEYSDMVLNENNHSSIKSKMGELGVKMLLQQNVNSWYNLSYGLHISTQNFIPQSLYANNSGNISKIEYGDRDLHSGTIFLDNKFNINKFDINIGGRVSLFNNNNESVVAFEPRVSVSYMMKSSSLWVSYVQNTQPLFSMNQTVSLPIDYWIPFQNDNELPTSEQFALGYKYNFDFGLEIFSEIYLKNSKNLSLIYNKDDFLLEEGGYNLATGEAYGAELMIQYKKGRFNFMGSYTYSSSHHFVDNQKIVFMFDTPHNLNLFGSYETVRKKGKKHTLSMNINYKNGLPYILANEAYPIDDPFVDGFYGDYWFRTIYNNPLYSNKRLNNFFRMDINYTMEKKMKRGSRIWQISILNATGYKNPYLVYPDSRFASSEYKAMTLIPFLPSFSYKRTF